MTARASRSGSLDSPETMFELTTGGRARVIPSLPHHLTHAPHIAGVLRRMFGCSYAPEHWGKSQCGPLRRAQVFHDVVR